MILVCRSMSYSGIFTPMFPETPIEAKQALTNSGVHPTGFYGLIEFRAIESLPNANWTGAVALLWRALLTYLLKQPFREALKDFNFDLHDKYFLPTPLWADLTDVLSELAAIRIRI